MTSLTREQAMRALAERRKIGEHLDLRTELEYLPELMSEEEVAAFLRMEERTLRRMFYDKRGPKTWNVGGGRHRIWKPDFIAWFIASTQ